MHDSVPVDSPGGAPQPGGLHSGVPKMIGCRIVQSLECHCGHILQGSSLPGSYLTPTSVIVFAGGCRSKASVSRPRAPSPLLPGSAMQPTAPGRPPAMFTPGGGFPAAAAPFRPAFQAPKSTHQAKPGPFTSHSTPSAPAGPSSSTAAGPAAGMGRPTLGQASPAFGSARSHQPTQQLLQQPQHRSRTTAAAGMVGPGGMAMGRSPSVEASPGAPSFDPSHAAPSAVEDLFVSYDSSEAPPTMAAQMHGMAAGWPQATGPSDAASQGQQQEGGWPAEEMTDVHF